jgi:hypothetical protein
MISLFDNKTNVEKLAKLDLQQKNKFKVLMFPSYDSFFTGTTAGGIAGGASALAGGALALLGNVVTSLYLQSITLPSSFSIEYEEISKVPKGLVKPEQVSMTFLEDEKGTVWRYLQTWRKTIAYVAPLKANTDARGAGLLNSAINTLLSAESEYVFADNQLASERIAILLPGKASDSTLTYGTAKFPRIMLYGLKFKGIEDLTFSNEEAGNLTYNATFSVREVAAPLV